MSEFYVVQLGEVNEIADSMAEALAYGASVDIRVVRVGRGAIQYTMDESGEIRAFYQSEADDGPIDETVKVTFKPTRLITTPRFYSFMGSSATSPTDKEYESRLQIPVNTNIPPELKIYDNDETFNN